MMRGRNKGATETAKRIPSASVGVEIGVWRGDSSELFLQRAAHLHLVDPWAVNPYRSSDEFGGYDKYIERYSDIVGSADPRQFQAYYDEVAAGVAKRFAGKPSVSIHRMTSECFFDTFDYDVDWVYIDGLHSFEGCLSDLHGAMEIVRPGGYIFGDDYGNRRGVTDAVRSLGVPFNVFGGNQYEIRVG